jgi:hypothetical protein
MRNQPRQEPCTPQSTGNPASESDKASRIAGVLYYETTTAMKSISQRVSLGIVPTYISLTPVISNSSPFELGLEPGTGIHSTSNQKEREDRSFRFFSSPIGRFSSSI